MKVELSPLLYIMKTFLFALLTLLSSVNLNANVHSITRAGDQQGRHDDVQEVGVHRCNDTANCFDYVTYHKGSETGWPPVILSAPHGGRLSPLTIPNRDAGCWDPELSKCVWSHTCGVKNATT
jgi:hypothetical protein